MSLRRLLSLSVAVVALSWASASMAVEPLESTDNDCTTAGGRGDACSVNSDCAQNLFATVCLTNDSGISTCEIPCSSDDGLDPAPARCSIGETCRRGRPAGSGSDVFYCKPERFRVDLNLLDLCIVHHLDKTSPVFTGASCSLQRNLNQLLDQNGDRRFDLFDLDLCVLAFLEQQGCRRDVDGDLQAVDEGVSCCEDDSECGTGSYCDPKTHICQRDCGIIASREEQFGDLERQCMAPRTTCQDARGRCVEVEDITEQTCEVDRDCINGSYCLLGRCAPNCYRAIDCPDSGWYCTVNNKCRALPPPESDEGFVFEPRNYAIRFMRDSMKLDGVQTFDSSQMAIMDLITKRRVVGNSSIAFGYRMEIKYGRKLDDACLTSFVDCSDAAQRSPTETELQCTARQDDCLIDPTEEWIRPISPFGMVSAAGTPELRIELEEAVADNLTPGRYPATVRLIFDNGDSDSIPVTFTKASPSGEYDGSLTVYMNIVENALNGNRPLTYGMRIKVYPSETRQWNELMAAQELDTDDEGFVDITTGQLVHASLHGETALAFSRGGALPDVPDEVHLVGLYSPDLGRLRLVGVIDIPSDFQIDADGGSCPAGSEALCAKNLFGRDIRRRIEFIGPFEEAIGLFHGIYRETITGLVPNDGLTLEGGFQLKQSVSDDTDLPIDSPIGRLGSLAPDFPTVGGAMADAETLCASFDVEGSLEASALEDFNAYIANAKRGGLGTSANPFGRVTVFEDLVEFQPAIEIALKALDTQDSVDDVGDPTDFVVPPAQIGQAHLNIYDFLEEWVVPCDDSDPSPPPGCIRENALRCGLAIHQAALLDGTIDMNAVAAAGGHPEGVEPDVFCLDTLPTSGCPKDAKSPAGCTTGEAGCTDHTALFAMQEHNRFWQNLAQVLKFEGDRARSDAFLVLFRNEVNPFAIGTAISYKQDALRESLRSYDKVVQLMVGTVEAALLFRWPARSFKQIGNDWLGLMQVIASDRMDALLELVDIERRVAATTDDNDFRFAQHLMQQEYLIQVYLMVLQQRWQQELFAYRGEAGPILQRGQKILLKLNPAKNELGITSNQVFFENSDPSLTNWESFREVLVGLEGDGGMVAGVQSTVADAVDEMQNALIDLDTFEETLKDARFTFQDDLNALCGDPTPDVASNASADSWCQELLKEFDNADDWVALRDCKFSTGSGEVTGAPATASTDSTSPPFACPAGTNWSCDTECADCDTTNCKTIIKEFVVGTSQIEPRVNDATATAGGSPNNEQDIINNPPRCGFEGLQATISIQGVQRPCVGGAMGEAFAAKASLDRERRIVIGSVQTLVRQVQAKLRLQRFKLVTSTLSSGLEITFNTVAAALDLAADTVGAIEESVEIIAEGIDCAIIAGLAVGTSCPQALGGAAIGVTGLATEQIIVAILKGIKIAFETAANITVAAFDIAIQDREAVEEILGDIREVDGLIDEYNNLTQESFNALRQMADIRFQAQSAADRFSEEVLFASQHLVGRESGNLLRGEALARDASVAYEDLLLFTYKMTLAYLHEFNVSPSSAAPLVAQALALVTVDDVVGFVGTLDSKVQNYCGQQGIDCDFNNNAEVLRFSLRDQLRPDLRDIIDARTGRVVTAGEQFHNIITSPPFLKRRFRGAEVVDQIELSLPLPITAKENAKGGPTWLIDPLSCNHKLDARKPNDQSGIDLGTHAVNFKIRNVDDSTDAIFYEMTRGPMDFMRSCTASSVQKEIGTLPVLQFPIRTWTIGYAPQNPNADQTSPPSYVSRSNQFRSCTNFDEVGGNLEAAPCWRLFARDRSLATLDGKLQIPLQVGGISTANGWLQAENLPEDERPIIEDIVIHFRYRTRPIQDN